MVIFPAASPTTGRVRISRIIASEIKSFLCMSMKVSFPFFSIENYSQDPVLLNLDVLSYTGLAGSTS
jgi:hypothetical protein